MNERIMLLQDRVVLITFNGRTMSEAGVPAHENYWILIRSTGTIASLEPPNGVDRSRVLVHFDRSLDALGLENHNVQKNSLWILPTDLEKI
jgi:acetylornithine/N-succinyldiaminopimelate aminotransferase